VAGGDGGAGAGGKKEEFKMKKPKETKEERLAKFKATCTKLIQLTKELELVSTEYQEAAENLAGCSLEGWGLADIDRYVALGSEFMKSIKSGKGVAK